jgi:hypothetical protein
LVWRPNERNCVTSVPSEYFQLQTTREPCEVHVHACLLGKTALILAVALIIKGNMEWHWAVGLEGRRQNKRNGVSDFHMTSLQPDVCAGSSVITTDQVVISNADVTEQWGCTGPSIRGRLYISFLSLGPFQLTMSR